MRFPTYSELTEEEIWQQLEKLIRQEKDYFDDSLMPSLLQLAMEDKKMKYRNMLTVMPEDKQTALYVDKSSAYMKNLLTQASATGEAVEIVTRDGTTFRCFVDTEEDRTDKIMQRSFDDSLLAMLFDKREPDGGTADGDNTAKAEAALMEMLNSMKHPAEDLEKGTDVA